MICEQHVRCKDNNGCNHLLWLQPFTCFKDIILFLCELALLVYIMHIVVLHA